MAGEIIVYTIEVSNAGPSDAQNVILQDNISTTIARAEFSADEGSNLESMDG